MTVYAAGSRSSGGKTTWKLTSAGAEVWSADHGDIVIGIAVDATTDAVCTVGNVSSSVTTRYYDASGTQQWAANHGGQTRGVVIDASGNVFTAGAYVSSISLRKYSSAGAESWNHEGLRSQGWSAFVNPSDGFIYFACAYNSSLGGNYARFPPALDYRNYDSLGQAGTLTKLVLDASGNIYAVGFRYTQSVWKYNSSFALQWYADHGANCYSVAVDGSGNVYVGGVRAIGSSNYSLRKYNASGVLQWSKDTGGDVWAVALDDAGAIWAAGAVASSYNLRRYDASGTLLGNWLVGGSTVTLYALAIRPDPPATLPALAVPLALAAPIGGGTIDIPALPLALALAVPTVPDRPAPPDPFAVALPGQIVYRCVLTGGDGVEVPLQSFQCRRRAGDSTWLAVTCPTTSAELEAAIASRIGAELLILSGLRSAAGVETLGQFIRAVLTDWTSERTPFGATLTLTARVVPAGRTPITRPLTGVWQRGRDEQNRRVVRCAVDPLLKPGDTVADAGDAFAVGAILYFIGPVTSDMTVTEA